MRRHRHRMHVAGLDYAIGMASAMGLRQTVILFRCENVQGPGCVESKTVSGHWDMHDLAEIPRDWPSEITRDDLPLTRSPFHEEDSLLDREEDDDAGTGTAGPATADRPDQGDH